VATAAMPRMSAHASEGDMRRLKQILADSMRLTLFIVLPSIAGLLALGVPLIAAFFQRGKFTYEMTWATYQALAGFSVGLWAAACIRQMVPAYYAMGDSRTPVKAAAASLAVYVISGLLLMGPFAHLGLALAVSISSVVNLFILAFALRRRLGLLGLRAVTMSAARSVVASAVMAVGVVLVARLGRWEYGLANLRNAATLLACLAVACVLYFGSAAVMRCPELGELKQALRGRRARGRTGDHGAGR
jgi:putative peptidoglycan lipid II flippase